MKKLNLGLMVVMLAFFNACASHNAKDADKSADRSTASDRPAQPAKTFNQYHNDWNY